MKITTTEYKIKDIVKIIDNKYTKQFETMKNDLIKFLYDLNISDENRIDYEDRPILYIVVDSDFDGYSSAKGVYHFFSSLGVRRKSIKFIHLNNLHSTELINLREQDLLVVLDTSWGNVQYKGEGKVWWIDHHPLSLVDYLRAVNKVTFINPQISNHVELQNLSCGMFTYTFLMCLTAKLGLDGSIENQTKMEMEKRCKFECYLSMISDRLPTENFPEVYFECINAFKTGLYITLKDKWCYDNRTYLDKYISNINNLIRMERYDLIEELIVNGEGGHIVRDVNGMKSDRDVLLNTYFKPLNPEWECVGDKFTVAMYQVPIESNSIMRNHKGLLASMKTNEYKGKPYMVMSRVSVNDYYNYSVRTNVGFDLKPHINKIEGVSAGGHKPAFGIKVPKNKEKLLLDNLKVFADTLNVETKSNGKVYMTWSSFKTLGDIEQRLYDLALFNETAVEPYTLKFDIEDFVEVKAFAKRIVYYLKIGSKLQEVVSFDLKKKFELEAKPKLKKSVKDIYSIDILE